MMDFESLHIAGLDEAELGGWIEASWVRARGPRGAWQFEAVDVARIRLIHTLRHELEIGEDAVPVWCCRCWTSFTNCGATRRS